MGGGEGFKYEAPGKLYDYRRDVELLICYFS